jgi:hypothetical protein
MFCSRTSMTIIEHWPVDGSNMKKADEHYEEIIQETNYSQNSCKLSPIADCIILMLFTKTREPT